VFYRNQCPNLTSENYILGYIGTTRVSRKNECAKVAVIYKLDPSKAHPEIRKRSLQSEFQGPVCENTRALSYRTSENPIIETMP
jgi:hypothetical protein